ncbi:hypothetical protein KBY58_05915 [Cyanobium sp. HWJ4-Hawea]|nr:hypothetical protein [Cyanobium sp. HWJ4-Hawea]
MLRVGERFFPPFRLVPLPELPPPNPLRSMGGSVLGSEVGWRDWFPSLFMATNDIGRRRNLGIN